MSKAYMYDVIGSLDIAQSEDYKIGLYRQGDRLRFRPYRVTLDFTDVPDRGGVVDVIVLAKDEQSAIGQAECWAKFESYAVKTEDYVKLKKFAVPVPMIIQGWGRSEF